MNIETALTAWGLIQAFWYIVALVLAPIILAIFIWPDR